MAAPLVYADANATTLMPPEVVEAGKAWLNCGDPLNGSVATAAASQQLLNRFKKQIEDECGIREDDFYFVLTSGAAEANVQMIEACVSSFQARAQSLPHLIVGAAEHLSIRNYCEQLRKLKRCTVSYAPLDPRYGSVTRESIESRIRAETCLISVSAAHHLTGALTNLSEINEACFRPTGRRRVPNLSIPLHTDAAQIFGRARFLPEVLGVDAFSVCFHKMHGPPGLGLLVLRKTLVKGFDIRALVSGRLLNVSGIAAARVAMQSSLKGRSEKNGRMAQFKAAILTVLREATIFRTLPLSPEETAELRAQSQAEGKPFAVLLTAAAPRLVLPNTLLLALGRGEHTAQSVTGSQLKRQLEEGHRVLCNACDELGTERTWMLDALRVPPDLHACVLRFSFTDDVTKPQAMQVAQGLLDELAKL